MLKPCVLFHFTYFHLIPHSKTIVKIGINYRTRKLKFQQKSEYFNKMNYFFIHKQYQMLMTNYRKKSLNCVNANTDSRVNGNIFAEQLPEILSVRAVLFFFETRQACQTQMWFLAWERGLRTMAQIGLIRM